MAHWNVILKQLTLPEKSPPLAAPASSQDSATLSLCVEMDCGAVKCCRLLSRAPDGSQWLFLRLFQAPDSAIRGLAVSGPTGKDADPTVQELA